MRNKTIKLVKNSCFGGFGLSDLAYEKLIEYGIPVRKYEREPRNPKTGLYDIKVKNNEGEIIFDRTLEDEEDMIGKDKKRMIEFMGRYWETWLDTKRTHPLLIKAVEELGEKANGRCAKLEIVKIPAGVKYIIDEYDGVETIREEHRTW